MDSLTSGTQDDLQTPPMERMEEALKLAREGHYEEALHHYLWCFDHGVWIDPSFIGVRGTFLIGDILKLAKKYRPALDALVARRDACGSRIEAGHGTREDVDTFVVLNREFRQEHLSVTLFESLPPGSTLWRDVGMTIHAWLLEQRRYSDLLLLFPPGETFQQQVEDLEMPGCGSDTGFKTALRDKLIRRCAPLVEALAGVGEHQQALDLARNILRAVRRPKLKDVLIGHAERANDLVLAEALKKPSRGRKSP